MTRIRLVVSDVDGTLLTKDKILTDGAKRAVRKLGEAGIGFTIVSSRPTIGMSFLIEPLAITLPFGAFNGSSIVDTKLKPVEQHVIPPAVARRSLDVLDEFGVDVWLLPTLFDFFAKLLQLCLNVGLGGGIAGFGASECIEDRAERELGLGRIDGLRLSAEELPL